MAGKMTAKAAAAAAKPPATRAYVTFLAGDGEKWKVVVELAERLREVGSAYPLVVAVLPDVPESRRRILVSHGCVVREIQPVCHTPQMDCFCDRTWSHTPQYKAGYCQQQFFPDDKLGSPLVVAVLPDVPEAHRRALASQGCIVREIKPVCPPENQTQFANDYYVINYSKLRIWEFVEYERMVYLDCDMQVLENMDELFELDKGHFYAVVDGFCDKFVWPAAELGPPPTLYFNAGMFVHEPSMATATALLDTLRVTPPTPFAEQDFLNMFFRDQFKPIPNVYNLVLTIMLGRHTEKVQLEGVKAVHYYCAAESSSKPWRYTGKEEDMGREGMGIEMPVKKWLDIYNDEKLPPFRDWLEQAKGSVVVFAHKNLPAVVTLAASSAAAGVVASAANPAICFGFYAVFVAAMAVITISLPRM